MRQLDSIRALIASATCCFVVVSLIAVSMVRAQQSDNAKYLAYLDPGAVD